MAPSPSRGRITTAMGRRRFMGRGCGERLRTAQPRAPGAAHSCCRHETPTAIASAHPRRTGHPSPKNLACASSQWPARWEQTTRGKSSQDGAERAAGTGECPRSADSASRPPTDARPSLARQRAAPGGLAPPTTLFGTAKQPWMSAATAATDSTRRCPYLEDLLVKIDSETLRAQVTENTGESATGAVTAGAQPTQSQ